MNTSNLSDVSAIYIKGLEGIGFTLQGDKKDTIYGVRQINVFIGANNSGKSRLLRAIFTNVISHIDIGSDMVEKLKLTILERSQNDSYQARNEKFHSKLMLKPLDDAHTKLDSELLKWIRTIIERYLDTKHGHIASDKVASTLRDALGESLLQDLHDLTESCSLPLNLLRNREYIPVLRRLRPLNPQEDLYRARTHDDYFEKDHEYEIFTGHSLYSELTYSLLGSKEERESVKQFEKFLSEYFFEGKSITLIPKKDREGKGKQNDVVNFTIDQEPMLPIYKLGDGIQAIITLTVRPFLTKKPTVFFIEEPEQHLHAGMQRALIQAFRACPQHKYFFTTQSNHFIDLSLESDDISLFNVKKMLDDEYNTKSEVVNQQDRSAILRDLGVLASSILLANCSIWVEGITDKLYLRVYLQRFLEELKIKSESFDVTSNEREEFLQRYKKLSSFNENLHYVFVEYQGSNITHWDFSDSEEDSTETPARMLSNDIFLLADQDIDKKGTRVEDLKKALGDNFCLLDWKEIENYIPHDVIIKTAHERWGTFRFKGKANSNFDPSLINSGAFENTIGIGGTLEQAVIRSDEMDTDRKCFETPSGTIKDKVEFCKTACKLMENGNTPWQLTPELEKLCDDIWTFIEINNKI